MKQLSDIPRGLRADYGRFPRWRNKHPQARLPMLWRTVFAGHFRGDHGHQLTVASRKVRILLS